MKQKVVEEVEIFLYMTEKEVAALAFPTLDGKFDYLGFAPAEKAYSLDSISVHSN